MIRCALRMVAAWVVLTAAFAIMFIPWVIPAIVCVYLVALAVAVLTFPMAMSRIPPDPVREMDRAHREAWQDVEDICAQQGVNSRGELVRRI